MLFVVWYAHDRPESRTSRGLTKILYDYLGFFQTLYESLSKLGMSAETVFSEGDSDGQKFPKNIDILTLWKLPETFTRALGIITIIDNNPNDLIELSKSTNKSYKEIGLVRLRRGIRFSSSDPPMTVCDKSRLLAKDVFQCLGFLQTHYESITKRILPNL